MKIIVGICREDNPRDVDEAYGPGTYARLFPKCEGCDDFLVKEAGDLCEECAKTVREDSRHADPRDSYGRP